MESTNVESQEPLFHDQTETSSKLKQEAAPQSPLHTAGSNLRPYHDSTFTFRLFLTAILTTFTFGIIASTRTDTLNMDTKLRLSNYNPTTNKCEITQPQTPKASDSDPDSDSAFVTLVALTSIFALALTIPCSLLLVSLLRRYTHPLVVLFSPFISRLFLGLSLTGGLLWFTVCLNFPEVCGAVMPGSSQISQLLSFQCISFLVYYELGKKLTGSAVENGIEALRMATGFWKENFVLLVVNPMLLMGWMVLVNGPIFTFMWYAFNVGEIVPDFDVVNDPIKGCGLATGIHCCREERPGWVYAYIIFASFTAFWVLLVSMALQHFVVSGTVIRWYNAPTGSSAIGNIKGSLGNAYGPSFGIACKLSTIISFPIIVLVILLKEKLNDKVSKTNDQGMILSILRRCYSWMSQFAERYPQLAFIFRSIYKSSEEPDNLNLQQTSPIFKAMISSHNWAIDALVGMTLMGMILICSLLQTLVVFGVLEYFSNTSASTNVLIAGVYCFPIIMIGLKAGFLQATSSVIQTVSICYAVEKDVREISKPEVCQAFMVPHRRCLNLMGLKLQGVRVASAKQSRKVHTEIDFGDVHRVKMAV